MAMKRIAEGAEANIYRTAILGLDAAVKHRIKKGYRTSELDESLRTRRTRTEAKVMALLHGKINIPELLLLGRDTIYMQYIEGRRLSLFDEGDPRLGRHLHDAGSSLGIMHNENVSHGDYTPANLIINNNAVCVIDFGLADMTNSIEDKALDLLLMKRSVSGSLYKSFLDGYRKTSHDKEKIIRKLAEIELRGRYQVRTLETIK
jgi:Kae1-associated kinase Bud32